MNTTLMCVFLKIFFREDALLCDDRQEGEPAQEGGNHHGPRDTNHLATY